MAARLSLVWGILLLLFGVAEVWTHRDASAGALAFWAGALLGGGTLVLVGRRLAPAQPVPGMAALSLGTLGGMMATAWTLVMPLLGLTALALSFRDAGRKA